MKYMKLYIDKQKKDKNQKKKKRKKRKLTAFDACSTLENATKPAPMLIPCLSTKT